MRKIILYIATSLDSYIARNDHSLDWLFTDQDYGYTPFLGTIDTTLMGYTTFEQVLGFGEFPYQDKKNFVFTRNHADTNYPYAVFISGNIEQIVTELKNAEGKDIWLIGGGEINTILLNANLIDSIIISIHPVILGAGIPLFTGIIRESHFELVDTVSFSSGLVQLTYKKIGV